MLVPTLRMNHIHVMTQPLRTLPMRLEVRDLRLVAAIVELGTLTRAGVELHLTQSALSHQLAELERRLGGTLFERSGRRLIPTALGTRLAARAKDTLRGLSEVEDEIAGMAAGRDAILRIATECYTCYHWLPPVLAGYGKRHPNVDVRIVPGATDRPLRALIAGQIDLCIVTNTAPDRRIITSPIFADDLVLIVDPAHPFAERRAVDPSELRDERIMLYSAPAASYVFQRVLAPAGVSPTQITPIKLTEAILELVKAGMGVSILARWAAQPALDAGSVVAIPVTSPGVRRQWQAAVRATRDVPAHLTDFVDFLRDTLAKPPRNEPAFSVVRAVKRVSQTDRGRV